MSVPRWKVARRFSAPQAYRSSFDVDFAGAIERAVETLPWCRSIRPRPGLGVVAILGKRTVGIEHFDDAVARLGALRKVIKLPNCHVNCMIGGVEIISEKYVILSQHLD